MVLTDGEAKVIANDITRYLKHTVGAKGVVNLNRDTSTFARVLDETLRYSGIGVTQQQAVYPNLNYRIEQLNPSQFVVTIELGKGHFSKIWALVNNRLVPLPTRTVFGGRVDGN
ncbi:hypothetical protein [Photobacterium damselae]|uniref:hypothetical protein n=1 Tax=Photobacterium damselae TaxID=38293 RepID=UPI001FD80D24|nr:hypothetical protein [Photobacterium damselae]